LYNLAAWGIPPGAGPDFHDRDRFSGKIRGKTVAIMSWSLP
jgi:hypothetical protein